mgnify:CR=1 FL=1
MGLLQNFRRQTLNLIAPAIGVCTVFYFGYHVLNGERGFLVWWDLRHRIQRAQSVADSTELKKRVLETRVRLLDPRSLDPDMLEERARVMLDYAYENDVIILDNERNR